MDIVFTNNAWAKMSEHIPRDGPKVAAVAYVSKGSPLKFGDGDILICDASASAIKSGETDAGILMAFKKNGARIYSCDNLHAKIMVCGKYAVIGSSNLSESSEESLLEASLITDRRRVRAQILGLIHNLMDVSEELDDDMIKKLIGLPVLRQPWQVKQKRRVVNDSGTSYWVASVVSMKKVREEEIPYVEEGEKIAKERAESEESEIGWIRFSGNSVFRQKAKPGDVVLEIFRDGRRTYVTEPRPILYRQDHGKWVRFYLEEKEDQSEMTWGEFEKKLRKVGMAKITKNSTRKLTTRDSAIVEIIWEA